MTASTTQDDLTINAASPLNAEVLAAFDAAQAVLAAAPTAQLLVTAYHITHQIHLATSVFVDTAQPREKRDRHRAWFRQLRQRRDMISAEIVRRVA